MAWRRVLNFATMLGDFLIRFFLNHAICGAQFPKNQITRKFSSQNTLEKILRCTILNYHIKRKECFLFRVQSLAKGAVPIVRGIGDAFFAF